MCARATVTDVLLWRPSHVRQPEQNNRSIVTSMDLLAKARPFPSAVRIGCDIARVSRFRALVDELGDGHGEPHPARGATNMYLAFVRKTFNHLEYPALSQLQRRLNFSPNRCTVLDSLARFLAGW